MTTGTATQQKQQETGSLTETAHTTTLPVKQNNVFHFPLGLPAFEHLKEFVFLCKPDTKPFFFMQSLKPADLTFVCIDPFLVYPGYRPDISEADVRLLGLTSPADAFLFSVVIIGRDVRNVTTNLQGPVVVNMRTGIGKQIICERQVYPVRFNLWNATCESARIALQNSDAICNARPGGTGTAQSASAWRTNDNTCAIAQ